jgi:hypothetical protein
MGGTTCIGNYLCPVGVRDCLLPKQSNLIIKLTTVCNVVARLKIYGDIPPLLPCVNDAVPN